MLGQAAEIDEMTLRRPSLIVGVFAVHKKSNSERAVRLACHLRVGANLRPVFSSSYTRHLATASKIVFFQTYIRSRHASITDESDPREEILSSSSS